MVRIRNVLKNLFFCALSLICWLRGLDYDIRQVYEDVYRQPLDCCVAEGKHLTTSPYLIITYVIPMLLITVLTKIMVLVLF
jgi:hypothetical protein